MAACPPCTHDVASVCAVNVFECDQDLFLLGAGRAVRVTSVSQYGAEILTQQRSVAFAKDLTSLLDHRVGWSYRDQAGRAWPCPIRIRLRLYLSHHCSAPRSGVRRVIQKLMSRPIGSRFRRVRRRRSTVEYRDFWANYSRRRRRYEGAAGPACGSVSLDLCSQVLGERMLNQ
jgi:hypothetical protein